MNRCSLFTLLLVVSAGAAGDESQLFMFAKHPKVGEVQLECAIKGERASSSEIKWSDTQLKPTTEVLFKPGERIAWEDMGDWQEVRSLDWSLPPLINHHRLEKLRNWTTRSGDTFKGNMSLPTSPTWELGLSVLVEDNAYIYLCEDYNNGDPWNCYWIIINGWPESGFNSTIRRCPGRIIQDRNKCENSRFSQGRTGPEGYWLHLKIAWNQTDGKLKVSFRDFDNTFKTFLERSYTNPFQPKLFASKSLLKEGRWVVHDYTVIGLRSSATQRRLTSKPFQFTSDTVCVTLFYLVYPSQFLHVGIRDDSNNQKSLGYLQVHDDSKTEARWRGKKFTLQKEDYKEFKRPHLVFDMTANQGYLAAVLDSVSVGQCDSKGDLLVSTVKIPKNDNPDISCYLADDTSHGVKWQKSVEDNSGTEDIRTAGRLCSEANNNQVCHGTILCGPSYCGCSLGYYAPICRPACGQYTTNNHKFGPGCKFNCGYCKLKWTDKQRCHPITGMCRDSVCKTDYRPPMCLTRLLTLKNEPELLKAEPTTLYLTFNVQDVVGEGTLASLEVEYRTKEMVGGDNLLSEMVNVTEGETQLSVKLTNLARSTQYEVRGILVDTEGGRYRTDTLPGFKSFNTTCEVDLQLEAGLDQNHPTMVQLNRNSSESESSCGFNSYILRQTSPEYLAGFTITSLPVTLSLLKPYTEYMYSLVGSENIVKTIKFKTLQDAPSKVQDLKSESGEVSITLTWNEPSELNGVITNYIVTYQLVKYLACQASESPSESMSNTTERRIVIKDLTPYAKYEITVTAVTIKPGQVATVTVDTLQTPLPNETPERVIIEPDETWAKLTWSKPDCRSVRGLFEQKIRTRITITRISPGVSDYNKSQDTSRLDLNLRDLEPFSQYNVSLQFVRSDGILSQATHRTFWTKPSAPSAVTNLTVFESFNDSLTVRWAPPPAPLRGELESYRVALFQYKGNQWVEKNTPVILSSSSSTCELWEHLKCYTLTHLEANLTYWIEVSAKNKDVNNVGPPTTVSETTNEKAPSAPLELTHELHADSVTMKWRHPDKPNGRIRSFALSFTPQDSWLRDKTLPTVINFMMDVNEYNKIYSHTVYEILPSTTYTVKVHGVTVKEGLDSSLRLVTPLAKADFKKNTLVVNERPETSATIIIPAAPRELTNESVYFVVVVPDKHLEKNSKTNDILNASLLRDEVLASISDDEGERSRAWIAAQLQAQTESFPFVIGEHEHCCNYFLDPALYYNVYVVALNKQGEEKIYSTIKTRIPSTSPTEAPPVSSQNSGLYALLLLLAFPAVGIYLLYKYRFKDKFGGGEQLMLYPSKKNAAIDMPSVTRPACPEPQVEPEQLVPAVVVGPRPLRPKSVVQSLSPNTGSYIKISDLSNYVHRSVLTGDLQKQHEAFPRGQTKPWDYGKLPLNKPKNRYGNLIAYDDTRVVLDKLPDDPLSDYINANYIDGYRKPRMYIATQGPRQNTVVDFWRMVWQEHVQVIAMVANVVENGKAKCEQYWPDSGREVTHGLVTILTGKVQVFADYTFRQFHLRSTANNETRKILQLHFTSWPDHGVPLYPQSVAAYLKKLLATPLGMGPMLVHCSAGVGRTGTIIVADACLRMAASERAVDVLSLLRRARECRANMVDNSEQYKLIHLVLIECLVTESTALQCDGNFSSKLKALKESGRMQTLYEHLDDPFDDNHEPDEDEVHIQQVKQQEREQRQHKNRFQDVVPESSGRVFLSRLDVNDPVSDYINAVSVDGFRIKDQFIATQFPLETTTADFWRLIAEKQVSVVVALNEIDLADETSCLFWPTPGALMTPTSYINVILKEELVRQHWVTRQFLLIIKNDTDSQVREWQVTMLHMIGWDAGEEVPKSNTSNIGEGLLEMWQETERVYSGEHPIVVCCYNGAKACGLFLALSFLIEKIKLEQECDVVHAVRTVRQNRKQFISSEVQFQWLYDAAYTYLEAFETYANFQ